MTCGTPPSRPTAGETLCEGEGSTAIHKAIAQGSHLDFFTLAKQILETYNPDSAYVALSRWNGLDAKRIGLRQVSDTPFVTIRTGC